MRRASTSPAACSTPDNGYDAFSLDNVRATLSDQPGHDRQETIYGSAKLSVAGASFDTQAHLGAATSDIAYGYDEDWVFPGFHPWGYNSTDNYLRDRSHAHRRTAAALDARRTHRRRHGLDRRALSARSGRRSAPPVHLP